MNPIGYISVEPLCFYTFSGIFSQFQQNPVNAIMPKIPLASFVRGQRKLAHLTQPQMAVMAGVGLRFVRDLEQGKTTLRLDKVEQMLRI